MSCLFIVSYWLPILFGVAKIIFTVFLGYCLFEVYGLFEPGKEVVARRQLPRRLSNGDNNPIHIRLENRYNVPIIARIIDELPIQFQYRESNWKATVFARDSYEFSYVVRPVKRGDYNFGNLVILVSHRAHFFLRRFRFDGNADVPVYPSFVHLRKYELTAFGNIRHGGQVFINKKLGHGMEFEQIKEYVQGDPQRWLNWKATAKHQQLMVNQYTDELSKDIWCFVDKGRLMKMPFEGMSLLDYAINAALAVSHIAIKAGDNAGLLTFSNKLSSVLMPSRRTGHMPAIMEALYNQRSHYLESNYELMTKYIQTKIRRRSLILLFTNFETLAAFRRQLKTIKRLRRMHLVVVFFFENIEVTRLVEAPAKSLREIYSKSIAEETTSQKDLMIQELKASGILAVRVKPEELSLKSINKYLEIKTRGLL